MFTHTMQKAPHPPTHTHTRFRVLTPLQPLPLMPPPPRPPPPQTLATAHWPPATTAPLHLGLGMAAHPYPGCVRREEEGSGTQKSVYQKWPEKIFPTVNLVFSHDGHFGLGVGGVPPSPPTVYGHSDTSLSAPDNAGRWHCLTNGTQRKLEFASGHWPTAFSSSPCPAPEGRADAVRMGQSVWVFGRHHRGAARAFHRTWSSAHVPCNPRPAVRTRTRRLRRGGCVNGCAGRANPAATHPRLSVARVWGGVGIRCAFSLCTQWARSVAEHPPSAAGSRKLVSPCSQFSGRGCR